MTTSQRRFNIRGGGHLHLYDDVALFEKRKSRYLYPFLWHYAFDRIVAIPFILHMRRIHIDGRWKTEDGLM